MTKSPYLTTRPYYDFTLCHIFHQLFCLGKRDIMECRMDYDTFHVLQSFLSLFGFSIFADVFVLCLLIIIWVFWRSKN